MNHEKAIRQQRIRRRFRVRKALRGTPERPRLSVHRSLKHIYCQVIDDSQGKTLVSASTRGHSNCVPRSSNGGNREAATPRGASDCRAGAGGRHPSALSGSRQLSSTTDAWPPWPMPPARAECRL